MAPINPNSSSPFYNYPKEMGALLVGAGTFAITTLFLVTIVVSSTPIGTVGYSLLGSFEVASLTCLVIGLVCLHRKQNAERSAFFKSLEITDEIDAKRAHPSKGKRAEGTYLENLSKDLKPALTGIEDLITSIGAAYYRSQKKDQPKKIEEIRQAAQGLTTYLNDLLTNPHAIVRLIVTLCSENALDNEKFIEALKKSDEEFLKALSSCIEEGDNVDLQIARAALTQLGENSSLDNEETRSLLSNVRTQFQKLTQAQNNIDTAVRRSDKAENAAQKISRDLRKALAILENNDAKEEWNNARQEVKRLEKEGVKVNKEVEAAKSELAKMREVSREIQGALNKSFAKLVDHLYMNIPLKQEDLSTWAGKYIEHFINLGVRETFEEAIPGLINFIKEILHKDEFVDQEAITLPVFGTFTYKSLIRKATSTLGAGLINALLGFVLGKCGLNELCLDEQFKTGLTPTLKRLFSAIVTPLRYCLCEGETPLRKKLDAIFQDEGNQAPEFESDIRESDLKKYLPELFKSKDVEPPQFTEGFIKHWDLENYLGEMHKEEEGFDPKKVVNSIILKTNLLKYTDYFGKLAQKINEVTF